MGRILKKDNFCLLLKIVLRIIIVKIGQQYILDAKDIITTMKKKETKWKSI